MSKPEAIFRKRLSRVIWLAVSSAVVSTIAACSVQQRSETPMNTTIEMEQAAGPLRKLKQNPTQPYEIRMTLKNAPGPFAEVIGSTQFDVVNYALCGEIDLVGGIAGPIRSGEELPLKKLSDSEYIGIMYADQIIDEDYFGRGGASGPYMGLWWCSRGQLLTRILASYLEFRRKLSDREERKHDISGRASTPGLICMRSERLA